MAGAYNFPQHKDIGPRFNDAFEWALPLVKFSSSRPQVN